MGATFAFTEAVVANQRETDDALNGLAGGCAAGFLAGIRSAFHPPTTTRLHVLLIPFHSTLPTYSCRFLCSDWRCDGYL